MGSENTIKSLYEEEVEKQLQKYLNWSETHWKRRIDKIFALVGDATNKKILDLGCGVGTYALKYAKRGNFTMGIDYTLKMVITGKNLAISQGLQNCYFINGDVSFLPFANDTFDVIIAGDIVEHLLPEVLKKTLQECRRVLTKGGLLVIHTWPTKYNYIFGHRSLFIFLFPFYWLPKSILKLYVKLIDITIAQIIWIIKTGKSRNKWVLTQAHCNLQSKDEFRTLIEKIGFQIQNYFTENTYKESKGIMKLFSQFDYAHNNIYAVCIK